MVCISSSVRLVQMEPERVILDLFLAFYPEDYHRTVASFAEVAHYLLHTEPEHYSFLLFGLDPHPPIR